MNMSNETLFGNVLQLAVFNLRHQTTANTVLLLNTKHPPEGICTLS